METTGNREDVIFHVFTVTVLSIMIYSAGQKLFSSILFIVLHKFNQGSFCILSLLNVHAEFYLISICVTVSMLLSISNVLFSGVN